MDRFQSRGRFIVGVSFDVPGMGYRNPRTGSIEGFEADLARAVAEGVFGSADRADFEQVTDEGRIAALLQDRVDFVVSQLTITPDRAEQVDFSVPYHVTGEAILVPAGGGIREFEDLKGRRIAVTAGSISERRMRAALPSLPGATLVVTPLSSGNLEALAQGRADAASNDMVNLTMLRRAARDPGRYEIIDIGDRFEPKPFGMAVRKGSASLLAHLNRVIDSLKADNRIARLLNEAVAGVGRD